MNRFLCHVGLGIMILCGTFLSSHLAASGCRNLHASCILIAELEQTKDSVNYGSGGNGTASYDSSGGEHPAHTGVRDTDGVIQYQAGPTRAQREEARQEESRKEAASLEMLQNMFIDIDGRHREGPLGEAPPP